MLPLRPHRSDGESALGYVMRLGEAHGVRDTHAVLCDIGFSWHRIAQGKDLRFVSRASGTDLPALMRDTGRTMPGGVRLRGEFLRRSQWSVHRGRRCCLICLAQDDARSSSDFLPRRWHRCWWDVQSLTVCPVHRIRLKSTCSRCDARLDFSSTPIDRCVHGHRLDLQAVQPIHSCLGDGYIGGRLGASQRIHNAVLDSGSLAEAIESLHLVGSSALFGRRERSESVELHALLDAGFEVFDGWPDAFDGLLTSLLRSSHVKAGSWGTAVAYGPLHAGLLEFGTGAIARLMKERMRHHAASEGVSFSKPVFGAIIPRGRYVTLKEAAKRLRSSPEGARAILSARGLISSGTRRGTPIRLPAAEVDTLAAERLKCFGMHTFSGHLGIGRTQARTLAAALYGRDRKSFTQTDVDELLTELTAGLPERFERTGAASLPDACRLGRCSIANLVQAIRGGTVRPAGRQTARGLYSVMIMVEAVRAVGNAARGTLTINEAAARLGVKWETMRSLSRLRLIRTKGGKVRCESLDAFRRDFIAGAVLARANGTNPKIIVERLANAGVTPVASPPQCRQVFYRRTDLVQIAGRKLRRPGYYSEIIVPA